MRFWEAEERKQGGDLKQRRGEYSSGSHQTIKVAEQIFSKKIMVKYLELGSVHTIVSMGRKLQKPDAE